MQGPSHLIVFLMDYSNYKLKKLKINLFTVLVQYMVFLGGN